MINRAPNNSLKPDLLIEYLFEACFGFCSVSVQAWLILQDPPGGLAQGRYPFWLKLLSRPWKWDGSFVFFG